MPKQRTITRDFPSISLTLPGNSPVTFSFQSYFHTQIIIPPGSNFSPGPHWHESYVEHVRIRQGRARVTIAGVSRTVGPEDGVLRFEKFVIHDFCRADKGKAKGEDGDVVLEEFTDPQDGFKQVFFYNVMSLLYDASTSDTSSSPTPSQSAIQQPTNPQYPRPRISLPAVVQLLTTISYLDNYVQLLPIGTRGEGLNYWLIHSIYGFGAWVGKVCGMREWFREYTPERLWKVAGQQPLSRTG